MKLFWNILTSISLFFSVPVFGQLTAEEHIGMDNISNISSKNSNILFLKRSKEKWNTRSDAAIIILDTTTQNETVLSSKNSDYDPKWSPSGKYVSFISYRNNLQQLYRVSVKGGEAQMISDAQAYLSNYQWYNDNVVAYVDDEPRDSLLVAKERENGGGYVVGTEFYTNALWMYDIQRKEKRKITSGDFRIINFTFSSDGKYLGILRAKNYDYYEAFTNAWIQVINLETNQVVYEFKDANAIHSPKFSENGTQIAFVGSSEGYASNDQLFVGDIGTGITTNLTYNFDPTINQFRWLNNNSLSFLTPRNGFTGIYKVNFEKKIETLVSPKLVIYDYQIINDEILFTASINAKPKQLYKKSLRLKSEKSIQLSNLNPELLPKIKTINEIINYKSDDGTNVQAIVNYPPNYVKDKKYPLMVVPHGGPDSVILNDFNWMGQFFADNGYVVFQPNFRGSIGYGRDFYAGNRNSFGDNDFKDVISGVHYLIQKGIVDEQKVVIGGWSYGGYMAGWAITQTNLFKASISIAGVFNLVSMYGQHEFSNRKIGDWEYKGRPIDVIENYRKASPLFFVKNVQTPLLILHGARDNRSHTLQAWEFYRAMKDANKEVKMILYPRAGHSISNPVQRKSVLLNWLNWANQHIISEK